MNRDKINIPVWNYSAQSKAHQKIDGFDLTEWMVSKRTSISPKKEKSRK